MKLFIVTAMIEPEATQEFWKSWLALADAPEEIGRVVVVNGAKEVDFKAVAPFVTSDALRGMTGTYLFSAKILGPVPAFAWGVEKAIELGADWICCFHDDMQFLHGGWDRRLREWIAARPSMILAGYGGGEALGHPKMYEQPYDPMSLARHNFVSNMRDAEAHGSRVHSPWQVACLDGFAQIGRADFFKYAWREIGDLGLRHHAYDSFLGVLAARFRREQRIRDSVTWMLPEFVHHAGGRTAVGNREYQLWAREQIEGGDQGFWEESHRKVWEASRGILPLGW